jgi:tetratricopeptide (TPR) repeat protein
MLHPDSTEGHFFKAVALGRYALFVGGKRKVQIAREVKMAVERTLQINPNHVGALHVLGRWHHELASLNFFERALAKIIFGGLPSGVSLEKAASYYERAIALNPNSPVHRLDYGRTLFKLGRLREARQQLEICIALPNVFWDDPQNKLEARKLLEKVSNL